MTNKLRQMIMKFQGATRPGLLLKWLLSIMVFLALTSQSVRAADLDTSNLPVWKLTLENDDITKLNQGATLAVILTNPPPQVTAAIGAGLAVINTVNTLGGKKGVDIVGVLGSSVLTVTPKGTSPYSAIVKVKNDVQQLGDHWAGIAISNIDKVSDYLAKFDPSKPVRIEIRKVQRTVEKIVNGLLRRHQEEEEVTHIPGGMVADRDAPGDWEKFILVSCGNNKVALRYHTGFLSAEGGGGGSTFANRSTIGGDWEKWEIVSHGGTVVSLKSSNGKFLCAENGGGREVNATRNSVGEWEKFYLDFHADGKATLKTVNKVKFVSAQP
ncbi:MAG: hypothetical protein QM703_03835 [Gemmatales bacterium]